MGKVLHSPGGTGGTGKDWGLTNRVVMYDVFTIHLHIICITFNCRSKLDELEDSILNFSAKPTLQDECILTGPLVLAGAVGMGDGPEWGLAPESISVVSKLRWKSWEARFFGICCLLGARLPGCALVRLMISAPQSIKSRKEPLFRSFFHRSTVICSQISATFSACLVSLYYDFIFYCIDG